MKKLLFLSVIFFVFQSMFAQTPGTIKWEFETYLNLGSPAIGPDGTIYTFTDSTILTAINPDGSKKWATDWVFEIGGAEYSVPVVGEDGTIYIIAEKFYAINPDGSKKWEVQVKGASPALSSDGTIYLSSLDGLFYAINLDGTIKWEFQTENDLGPASVATDGTVYFGSGQNLFALNPDGTKKWTFQANSKIKSAPAIGVDGLVYSTTETGLLALYPDGVLKWQSQIDNEINSSLAIAADGTIYGVSDGYKLYAIAPDGNKKWVFLADSSYSYYFNSSTPAIGSNGTIYVGLTNKFFAINPNGTSKWEFQSGDIINTSPAIASDGTIYFGVSWDNKFYALYSDCFGLADSSWPKFRKNNQNQAGTHNENCPVARVVQSRFTLRNGGQVTFDASPSSDPDGDALSYLWCIVEKPQGSPLTLTDSTSEVVTVDIPSGQFAEYRFSLKITDGEDGSSWTPLFVSSGKKWTFKTDAGVYSEMALGLDGTVYAFSDKLYAINDDGTTKWEYDLRGIYGSQISIGPNGNIYATRYDKLYAFDDAGTKLWEFDDNKEFAGLAIGPDGTICLTTDRYNDSYLLVLNPDGTEKWRHEIDQSTGSPVIASDGSFYYCSLNKLIALYPDGSKKWDVDIAGCSGSPAIDADGTLYVNASGMLYALRPDGTIKWATQTGSISVSSSPVIASDGTIYTASDKLYAVNRDGTKKWDCAATGSFSSTPAVGSDGMIYIGSRDSSFYAIHPDGTINRVFKTKGEIYSSPVIYSDGTVCFGSADSTVYALYFGSVGLADSPWPKYGKNNQNQASGYNENCPQARVANGFIYVQPGGHVTLDGSSSYDPDGESLSYLWRIAEKPVGSSIALIDSTSSVITLHIPDEAYANYRISLTVTDGDDGYSSASETISTAMKWQIDLGGYNANLSPPAVAADGTIYIGADSSLYAINPDGTNKWVLPGDQNVDRLYAPSLDADGTVYFAIGKKLYAVNPDGTLNWLYESSHTFSSSPAIASDGSIYVGSKYGWGWYLSGLSAFDPDGTLKWEQIGANLQPCIGPDGTIYGSSLNYIGYQICKALNPDGTVKFTFEQNGKSPVIGRDGTIYMSSDALYALNPDGSQKWKFDTGHWFIASHAIGSDGTIYAGTSDSMFYAITSSGVEKWALKLDYSLKTCPAIGADGTIFFGAGDDGGFGKFYAINPDGTIKVQLKTNTYMAASPAIAADGTVYIGFNNGQLAAFNSECGGLADSPWPKYAKDNSNTSSVYNVNCPVAKVAEQSFTLENGGEITLDASSSYDPDGDALSYLWRVTEMPEEKPAVLSNPTSAVTKVTIQGGYPAYYKFSLKVTDNKDGASWTQCNLSTGKKWAFQGGNHIYFYSSPVIGQDGTIYIISDTLYALNNDMSIIWKVGVHGDDLAIGSSGVIYVASSWEELSAYTPEGKLKWTYNGGDDVGECAIGSNDEVFIGFGDKLFAIDSAGTKKWEFATNSNYQSIKAPAISSNGIIYLCSGNKLFALIPNGTKFWEYETEYAIGSSPVIAADGTIYICSAGHLYAISPAGTKKWISPYCGASDSSPSIGKDHRIYLGTSDGLYALNPDDGSVYWKFGESLFDGSSPAVGQDGTIYMNGDNYYGGHGPFYAINPDGTEKWRFKESAWSSSPAIGSDGIIYFTSSYSLFALHSESGGLADSPWPKYRHDNRNTGNVNTPTPIEDDKPEIPKKYALFPMYPNPFNPTTAISYQLPAISKVNLSIYNILGQKVAMLVNEKQPAGTYKVKWDASRFASGMYFIRFESATFIKVRKCLLLK